MKKLPLLLTASLMLSSAQLTAICPCSFQKKEDTAQSTEIKKEDKINPVAVGIGVISLGIIAFTIAKAFLPSSNDVWNKFDNQNVDRDSELP